MSILPSQYKVLFSLLDGPKGFNAIVRAAGLSSATVDKWLKILEKMGYVAKRGRQYEITSLGVESLRSALTEVTRKALDLGLVSEIELAVTSDARIEYNERDDYVLYLTHYGEVGETKVKVSLGDSRDDIIRCLKRLIIELGGSKETS